MASIHLNRIRTSARLTSLALIVAFGLAQQVPAAGSDAQFIVLQSTTSTENSGLLDYLLPHFRRLSGIEVRVVAVGTGQALRNARNGDGDVLLVHARERELEFVEKGFGIARHDVMYNDFVLVGPSSDPAGVRGTRSTAEAMSRIARSRSLFASRGDDSGTHTRERQLWRSAGVDPAQASGKWYREMGSGMGATLNAAVAMGAYTLADRATWTTFANKAVHRIVLEGAPQLENQYGVIVINPTRHAKAKAELGKRFVHWLLSAAGQDAIASFKPNGIQLFFPNARAAP